MIPMLGNKRGLIVMTNSLNGPVPCASWKTSPPC